MKVLLTGATGLVGGEVLIALLSKGHEVVAVGRNSGRIRIRFPEVAWIEADLRDMRDGADWLMHVDEVDAVVNCAGVLQNGVNDDVAAVQSKSMKGLFNACQRMRSSPSVVQISAVGSDEGSTQEFMRTKGEADAALAASPLDWFVLRPGLVLAPVAYGGSAALRALAAFPFLTPVPARSTMRTVWVRDVADAVLACLEGRVPSRRTYDLVEDEAHPLSHVLASIRRHLGLPASKLVILPLPLVDATARLADVAGRLGWRSPLRSAATLQAQGGVGGDPMPWRQVTGRSMSSLEETLRRLPLGIQDRWFARLWLMKPLMVITLAMFWTLSGLIALAEIDAASGMMGTAFPHGMRVGLVVLGAFADIGLGGMILVRRTSRHAALGMALLSLLYLIAGSMQAPSLWLDPIGPYMKVLPGIILALLAAATWDDR